MKKLSLIFFTTLIIVGMFAPIIPTLSTAYAQISAGDAAAIAGQNQSQDYDISSGTTKTGEDLCPPVTMTNLNTLGCRISMFVVYTVFYTGTSFLASITALLADTLLWQSLQSWTYQNDFILNGWTIMRDMANISFIAGLLYAAFLLMSGNDGLGKKTVYMVIMLALAINFSLFFTRLMIDGGNILARSIYKNIEVSGIDTSKIGQASETEIGSKKQISVGLVNIMNPQKILLGDVQSDGSTIIPDGNYSVFTFLFIFAGIVNILMMFMFIKIGLSFLGRTVGLMILMIIVPVTVISELLPVKKMLPKKYLTIEGWFGEVWRLVMMAPIYVFFIYLMILFFSKASGQFSIADSGLDWISRLVSLSMPIIMTYFLMKAATDMTETLSGEIGGMVAKTVGAVGGAVIGGAAMLVGGAAGSLIGGGLGSLLQRQGAEGAVDLKVRKDYQSALKKKKSGEALNESEQAAFKKVKSLQAQQKKLKLEGKDLTGKDAELLSKAKSGVFSKTEDAKLAMSEKAMKWGSGLKKVDFDARKFNAFGLTGKMNLGTALAKQGGLGEAYGIGGVSYMDGKGSYNDMVAAIAKKEADRIGEQAALIDQATKNNERKYREKVEKNESSAQMQDARQKREKELEGIEKGRKLSVDEKNELDALRSATGTRKLDKNEKETKVTNAAGATVDAHTLTKDELAALLQTATGPQKVKLDAEEDKRKAKIYELDNREKSMADLDGRKEQLEIEKARILSDQKSFTKGTPEWTDLQNAAKEKEAELSNIRAAKKSRSDEKGAIEKSLKDQTFLSEDFNKDQKELDKIKKNLSDIDGDLAKEWEKIEKIKEKNERERRIEELKKPDGIFDKLEKEKAKLAEQERLMRFRKGQQTEDDKAYAQALLNDQSKGNYSEADKTNPNNRTKVQQDVYNEAQKAAAAPALDKTEQKELATLRKRKTTELSASELSYKERLERKLESSEKIQEDRKAYAFAEKVKTDKAGLEAYQKSAKEIKERFIREEIDAFSNMGDAFAKSMASGLGYAILGAVTGGLSAGAIGAGAVGGAVLAASLGNAVKDSVMAGIREGVTYAGHDASLRDTLRSRFRDATKDEAGKK